MRSKLRFDSMRGYLIKNTSKPKDSVALKLFHGYAISLNDPKLVGTGVAKRRERNE